VFRGKLELEGRRFKNREPRKILHGENYKNLMLNECEFFLQEIGGGQTLEVSHQTKDGQRKSNPYLEILSRGSKTKRKGVSCDQVMKAGQ